MISFNPLWRHQIDFQHHCLFVRGTTVDSPHEGSNADLWCFYYQSGKTVEQTLDLPVFRDAMTIIWRRRNVLNSQYGGSWWPNVYLVPRHLKPLWRNRTVAYLLSCIFFYQNCPVVSATLRKWQRYPMQETTTYCNAVYSRLVFFFLLKRHRMSPVQVVTPYKPIPSCCFIKGTLYFGYA